MKKIEKRFKTLYTAIVQENEYRRVANIILEHVKSATVPFIGKKIETQTGLTAKYAEALNMRQFDKMEVNPLPGGNWARIHHISIKFDYANVYVEISLVFGNGNGGCIYDKQSFYFGKMENGLLASVNENCKVETEVLNYEVELGKIMQYRKAEKEMQDIKSTIRVGSEVYKYMEMDDF